MSRSNLISAIDLGTSKTVVLLADRIPGRPMNIIGFYEEKSVGVSQGELTDTAAATKVVQRAIVEAERVAGIYHKVHHAWLSVSGTQLGGFRRAGFAAIHQGKVEAEDIESARRDAVRGRCPSGRHTLDAARGHFFVDGRPMANPLGAEGRVLEMRRWEVSAPHDSLLHLLHIPTTTGLEAERVIPSSIASAFAVTDSFVRNQGVLVIDMGAGATDFALYRAGNLLRTGVVPQGGEHLTLALSRELQVGHRDAESIKRTLARAYSDEDDAREVVLFHRGESVIGGKELRRRKINTTVEKHLKDIFTRIREELAEDFRIDGPPYNGVVLTGGGSRLAKLEVYAERIFGIRATLGDFSQEVPARLAEQEYATALGLVHLFDQETSPTETKPRAWSIRRAMKALGL